MPKYDIIFLLSGGGKLNYLASKTWLERRLQSDSPESAMLNEVEFVLCLDSIGKDGMHFHVSKQPKEGLLNNVRVYFKSSRRCDTVQFQPVNGKQDNFAVLQRLSVLVLRNIPVEANVN